MGRPKKTPKTKGQLEEEVGRHLRVWIDSSLRRYPTETKRFEALSLRSGVGKETIRNIVQGSQSARIDNLRAITEALGYGLVELFSLVEKPKAAGKHHFHGDEDVPIRPEH